MPSYCLFYVRAVGQLQLCHELPCIPVGFMLTYYVAQFSPSAVLLLASDGDTIAVRSLLSTTKVAGKTRSLWTFDSRVLCVWKASASTAMQVVPLRGCCLLLALQCQSVTVGIPPTPSLESVLASVRFN